MSLLEVRDLTVAFGRRPPAVRDVSFTLEPGHRLGIIGESGSGKTVTALALMGLLPETAHVTGSIRLAGRELVGLPEASLAGLRGDVLSMVFQEPMTSLNPVYTVGDQISEALRLHDRHLSAQAAAARAVELLKVVGIPDAERRARAFPHEYSGGMRQRVMIAMAIANDPKVILADEPTTALDVTIQAQILEVLEKAKDITGASVVLITHDLGVVASMADRVAVMYAGKVVETGTCEDIFYRNAHPYTQALLKSLPSVDMNKTQRLVSIPGTPPDLLNPPKGCGFGARCTHCMKICHEEQPPVFKVGEGHEAACWLLHPDCPSAAERGEPDEQ